MTKVLDSFLEYLKSERNRSMHTIDGYEVALRGFQQFIHSLDDELTWNTVDADVVRDWILYLLDENNIIITKDFDSAKIIETISKHEQNR